MEKLLTSESEQQGGNLLAAMHYLGLPVEGIVDEDFAKLDLKTLHVNLPYKSPPFRTNLYSVTLVMDGYGHYITDNSSVKIQPCSLIFNTPGGMRQVEWYSIKNIFHYSFSEQFLLKYSGVYVCQLFPFFLFETSAPFNANLMVYDRLAKICLKIDAAYKLKSTYRNFILANLLIRLLLEVKRTFWPKYQVSSRILDGRDILRIFFQQLEEHIEELRTGKTVRQLRVKDYAHKQSLHEYYFSQLVKTKTGKKAKQWIDEKMCTVAIMMIRNSPFSIKQIAFRLGFRYLSHFTAYVKKTTGHRPDFYRTKVI